MCVPGCIEKVKSKLHRRAFLKSVMASTAYAAVGCATTKVDLSEELPKPKNVQRSFTNVTDLTHTLSEEFPTFFGKPMFKLKANTTYKKDHFNTNYIDVFEHVGTHIDAPIHFSEQGKTVDEIQAKDLVLSHHIINIKEKSDKNPDSQVTLNDIQEYESRHGKISDMSCVSMYSGWGERVHTKEFRNLDQKGQMHFPGFSVEAVTFLAEQRNVSCIAVDTLSLDYGISKDFGTHYFWLPLGKYGIECLANLNELPAKGSTIVVGAPKFKGGSGGPSRIFALV